ncbi:MAG: hypothetical protein F6K40_23945 [Okeania sp. SIO3I5]|uniref:hypothetical protein n=1 Tax=Okeania sp. SIO3I5 TaxID=2607805 RepID=UPI0013B78315|nr:hypothetical protein [Okeania sp. SIO3I5]NEQ39138.1 hypothetical protein [Okeania sp. SIO3I5]
MERPYKVFVVPVWFINLKSAVKYKPSMPQTKILSGGEVDWHTATSYDATKAFIHVLFNQLTKN